MAGRRPKPTRLKQLLGNPGKRRLNANEPDPAPGLPECPPHLSAIARQEWDRISHELLELGLLTSVDRAALAGYCQSWARWVDAELNLQKYGAVIKTKNDNAIQNPYLSIANTALEHMRKFLTEFGMTPSSRSRIHVKRKADEAEGSWEEMFGDKESKPIPSLPAGGKVQ